MPGSQVNRRGKAVSGLNGQLSRLLGKLLTNAAAFIDINPAAALDCIHQASALLIPTPDVAPTRIGRHTLAPWQANRIRAYIDENIAAPISIEDLAGFTRLSTSYFFRAFKGTFGVPPHAYIVQRRMARAQLMLSGTDEPLGQIAVACGLADQAHFSRLFRRTSGVAPGVWRRELRGGRVVSDEGQ